MRTKSNSRRELGRKRGLASAAAWKPCRADADTMRQRAISDARGEILRTGVTYFGIGRVAPWLVRRSVAGRCNQLDLLLGGRLVCTGSARALARLFRSPPKSTRAHPRANLSA